MTDGAAIPIVVNSAAGGRRHGAKEQLQRLMAGAGVQSTTAIVEGGGLQEEIRRAASETSTVVGVAGGDGTLLTAAEVLAGGEVALAPIPVGTLNHFARRLGLRDPAAAARAIRGGHTSRLPLGIVDDRVFLNTATFGFYADVVRRRERIRRAIGKWPAAVAAFAATLSRVRMMDLTLVVEGRRLRRRTGLVWVGVGWGSFPLVHESPDRRSDPELEIVVLRPQGIAGSLRLILRVLTALRRREHPVEDAALEVLHARHLLIDGPHRVGVTLDGEVFRCRPPILIAIQPGALRVVTPEPGVVDEAKQGV